VGKEEADASCIYDGRGDNGGVDLYAMTISEIDDGVRLFFAVKGEWLY
jgi:hypothetical protein